MRTARKKKFKKRGGLAQLGERLPYKQDVIGSSPITPTIIYLRRSESIGSQAFRRILKEVSCRIFLLPE